MRIFVKTFFNKIFQLIMLPFALTCWIEHWLCPASEIAFSVWVHLFALLPGWPGVFLRRGFYSLTLEKCDLCVNVGFGSIFTHRAVVVEKNVSIGNYAIVGSAHIGARCEVASRVSIVSGKNQHEKAPDGHWTPFDQNRMQQVKIGADVWIGEGAIVMADIGAGCLVAGGAVVVSEMPANIVAAGNPARVVRKTGE